MNVESTIPQPAVDPEIGRILGLGKNRKLRRIVMRIAIAMIAAAGVLAVGWWWRARHTPAQVAYTTAAVARGELAVTVTATGTLEPRHTIEVGSEVSGRVRRVLVDFNDHVTRGQLIAEIDPEVFEAQVLQARAQLRQARAQLSQARTTQVEARANRVRADGLYAEGVIATADREAAFAVADRADAAVELAAANVDQATAVRRIAETNLTRTAVRSPIDGVVLDRRIEVGQTVVASFQAPVLFTIAEDLTAMQVVVDVDEADIALVEPGQAATFTVSAHLGREFPATVASVHEAARLVDRVVSYQAELDVDNREQVLRPGMTVTAQIIARRVPDAVTVPNQALRFSPASGGFNGPEAAAAGPEVWVLRDGVPVAVAVEVGLANDTRTEIRSGALAPGDPVIVDAR